jgi:hypothetical protein
MIDQKRMMMFFLVGYLLLPIILVDSIRIPFIDNATLKAGYSLDSIVVANQTRDQCLCKSSLSYPAVNWFPNNTCQLFVTFPPTYRIEVTQGARLYFPQRTFPNISQCCMPDINYLLNQLQMALLTSANASNVRNVALDDYGYVVTVEETAYYLDRFDTTNLTRINHLFIGSEKLMAVAYNQGAYYVATNNNSMMVIDGGNLSTLINITLTYVNGPRDIIFLNQGQTMVVTSNTNNSLVFFNRSNNSYNYTFSYLQSVSYVGPHGLWRVNDSFFYVTSYTGNAIYSYSATGMNGKWIERWVFTAPTAPSTIDTTHVTIDECNRFWLSVETDAVQIYDQQGNLLGNYTIPNSIIFDVKMTNNYLMYFSDKSNRIIRVDPNIEC